MVTRRRFVGALSNDIGFKHTIQGFIAILSEYDRRMFFHGEFSAKLRSA